MDRTISARRRILAAFAAAAWQAVVGAGAAAETIVYDLQWNGPETSTVEESHSMGFWSFAYPIDGMISVTLGPDAPSLANIDSTILVPPDVLPANSPLIWDYLHLLEGEYLSPSADSDVSMVFRPASGVVMPLEEMYVDLSDGLAMLTLTGEYRTSAASPLEHDIDFAVSGRATLAADLQTRVPEPGAATLALVACGAVVAAISGCRQAP